MIVEDKDIRNSGDGSPNTNGIVLLSQVNEEVDRWVACIGSILSGPMAMELLAETLAISLPEDGDKIEAEQLCLPQ